MKFFPYVTLAESLAKNTKIVIRCKRYKSNLFILRHDSSVLSKKITKNVVEKLFIWYERGTAAANNVMEKEDESLYMYAFKQGRKKVEIQL